MNWRALGALLLSVASTAAYAHKQSDSYVRVHASPGATTAHVQLDLSLLDLEHAIGIDVDGDGAITWGELQASEAVVRRYVEPRVALVDAGADAATCPLHFERLRVDRHTDGAYAVLDYAATCAAVPASLELRYALFFDLDAAHHALVSVSGARGATSGVIDATSRALTLDLAPKGFGTELWQWLREGVWHIWTGYDHLLFLLTLLLPAVVLRRDGMWVSQPSLRVALVDIARVVTAFTVAHSLTLTAAALGWLHVDSRVVESGIALTVLLGALNILFPVVRERRWLLALVFGLVHGLGFAAVLSDLGLEAGHLLRDLVAFNVGVELGQLAIVALVVPLAFRLRERRWYRTAAMPGGAAAAAVVALWWFVTRAFG